MSLSQAEIESALVATGGDPVRAMAMLSLAVPAEVLASAPKKRLRTEERDEPSSSENELDDLIADDVVDLTGDNVQDTINALAASSGDDQATGTVPARRIEAARRAEQDALMAEYPSDLSDDGAPIDARPTAVKRAHPADSSSSEDEGYVPHSLQMAANRGDLGQVIHYISGGEVPEDERANLLFSMARRAIPWDTEIMQHLIMSGLNVGQVDLALDVAMGSGNTDAFDDLNSPHTQHATRVMADLGPSELFPGDWEQLMEADPPASTGGEGSDGDEHVAPSPGGAGAGAQSHRGASAARPPRAPGGAGDQSSGDAGGALPLVPRPPGPTWRLAPPDGPPPKVTVKSFPARHFSHIVEDFSSYGIPETVPVATENLYSRGRIGHFFMFQGTNMLGNKDTSLAKFATSGWHGRWYQINDSQKSTAWRAGPKDNKIRFRRDDDSSVTLGHPNGVPVHIEYGIPFVRIGTGANAVKMVHGSMLSAYAEARDLFGQTLEAIARLLSDRGGISERGTDGTVEEIFTGKHRRLGAPDVVSFNRGKSQSISLATTQNIIATRGKHKGSWVGRTINLSFDKYGVPEFTESNQTGGAKPIKHITFSPDSAAGILEVVTWYSYLHAPSAYNNQLQLSIGDMTIPLHSKFFSAFAYFTPRFREHVEGQIASKYTGAERREIVDALRERAEGRRHLIGVIERAPVLVPAAPRAQQGDAAPSRDFPPWAIGATLELSGSE